MRKGEVMRPFRAPRSRAGETAAKASPTRQSPRRKYKRAKTKHDTEESEGPTELRVTRWLIPETEEGDQDITDNTIETTTNALLPNETLKSTAASPPVLEFENYLEEMSAKGDSSTVASASNNMAMSTTLPATRPAHLGKDEWWESVLRAEQERIKQLQQAHLLPVNEMFFDTVSSDDDVPIVNTLLAKTTKVKKKKSAKTLWSYETVEEATGIRSNYWDAAAPIERATKRLAKQKIYNLKDVENQAEGAA